MSEPMYGMMNIEKVSRSSSFQDEIQNSLEFILDLTICYFIDILEFCNGMYIAYECG